MRMGNLFGLEILAIFTALNKLMVSPQKRPTKRAATVLKVRSKTTFLVGRLRQVRVTGRVSTGQGANGWALITKIHEN